jgi:UDP-N-acetyl-D-mannosaminuronic acid transferase (WecB/TagA/CpsF family)
VPSAPALRDIGTNLGYRQALLESDVVIADSAYMVLIWRVLQSHPIHRVSGLLYIREVLARPEPRIPGSTFWIMAGPVSAERNLAYLRSQNIEVPPECVYQAPFYGQEILDEDLLAALRRVRPKHIVVTLGGGTQERVGLYIKKNLDYLPGIHCIGAAIAFLSGDQVAIPDWADKLYLGWLFRCISRPRLYIPRYWNSLGLVGLMVRYRSRLPPISGSL